jgi:osmoprotectant transport system ATP-binding protein
MSITFQNVTKSFDNAVALQGFSFEFKKGRTSVLIGSSGCGKSTLLRLIVGLIKQDSGTILIEDKLPEKSNLSSLRKKIGYVIQEGGLFPHLNTKENVSLMAKYFGWNETKIGNRINELTELSKFKEDLLNRYPSELSGGQRQRVSLMRALMLDPEFLLLDEPLGSLDPLIRYELQEDLKNIFERLRKTVILVTHDLNEAVFFADEIVLMKEGRIIQKGSINEMIKFPSAPFVTRFINAQRSEINFNNEN